MEWWIPGPFHQLQTYAANLEARSCICLGLLCRIIVWDIENTKSIISHRGEFFLYVMQMYSIVCPINHTGHSDTVSSVATHPSSENCFISTSQVSIITKCVCTVDWEILLVVDGYNMDKRLEHLVYYQEPGIAGCDSVPVSSRQSDITVYPHLFVDCH